MTGKEAARILYNEWQGFLEDNIDYAGVSDAYKMAIKALEQENVLDEIRTEITVLDDADYDYEGYYKAVTDALKIIDKYRAESEGTE